MSDSQFVQNLTIMHEALKHSRVRHVLGMAQSLHIKDGVGSFALLYVCSEPRGSR